MADDVLHLSAAGRTVVESMAHGGVSRPSGSGVVAWFEIDDAARGPTAARTPGTPLLTVAAPSPTGPPGAGRTRVRVLPVCVSASSRPSSPASLVRTPAGRRRAGIAEIAEVVTAAEAPRLRLLHLQ